MVHPQPLLLSLWEKGWGYKNRQLRNAQTHSIELNLEGIDEFDIAFTQ